MDSDEHREGDLTVRAARVSDERALAEIDHACWSPLTDPGEHWTLERPFFSPRAGARPSDVLVAVVQDEVLGFVKIRPEGCRYGDWYIGGLGVAPRARRRGLGTQLVKAALARVASQGGGLVWLKVLSSSGGAMALYDSLGFAEVARFRDVFPGRPGVDDLRFARFVAPRTPELYPCFDGVMEELRESHEQDGA